LGRSLPKDIPPSTPSYHTPDRWHWHSIKDLLRFYSGSINTTKWPPPVTTLTSMTLV
jgi:hypothetical protein